MRASLLIRFIPADMWERRDVKSEIMKDPNMFLCLKSVPKVFQHPSCTSSSLVGSMAKVLEGAAENGDVAFIVGQSATKLRAHSFIVSAATPVKLFHGNMREGIIKEVRLPQFEDKVFRSERDVILRRRNGAC